VLINVIVVENNTSTTHTRGKQKSASTQNKKDKTVELIQQKNSPDPTKTRPSHSPTSTAIPPTRQHNWYAPSK
jgi:hypothetical protein